MDYNGHLPSLRSEIFAAITCKFEHGTLAKKEPMPVPAPANRLKTLPPYAFAVLTQRVRDLNAQGMDVIGLDIGSPDMPPPDVVIEALEESAQHPGHHTYGGYKGTAEFRTAVAGYYQQRFGVTVNPETQ